MSLSNVSSIVFWLISAYNGFAVSWMDHHEFARRIEELLRNKTLAREMGRRGRRMVEQKFNLSAYITGVENMLTQLLGEQEAVA